MTTTNYLVQYCQPLINLLGGWYTGVSFVSRPRHISENIVSFHHFGNLHFECNTLVFPYRYFINDNCSQSFCLELTDQYFIKGNITAIKNRCNKISSILCYIESLCIGK